MFYAKVIFDKNREEQELRKQTESDLQLDLFTTYPCSLDQRRNKTCKRWRWMFEEPFNKAAHAAYLKTVALSKSTGKEPETID